AAGRLPFLTCFRAVLVLNAGLGRRAVGDASAAFAPGGRRLAAVGCGAGHGGHDRRRSPSGVRARSSRVEGGPCRACNRRARATGSRQGVILTSPCVAGTTLG